MNARDAEQERPVAGIHYRPSATRRRAIAARIFAPCLALSGLIGCTAILGFDKSVESADDTTPVGGADAAHDSNANVPLDGSSSTDGRRTSDDGSPIDLPTEPYLDPTFGHRGRVEFPELPPSSQVREFFYREPYACDVIVLASGGTAFVCGSNDYGFAPLSRLIRLHADGSLDTTFGAADGGGVRLDGIANAIGVQGSKIVAAGADSSNDFLMRFALDGMPDTTLSATGKVRLGMNSGSFQTIAEQANGDLLLSGSKYLGPSGPAVYRGLVARFVTQTSTFSPSVMSTDGFSDFMAPRGTVTLADGRVILFGDFGSHTSGAPHSVALVAFKDGAVDTTFGTNGNGMATYTPDPALRMLVNAGDKDSSDRIVLAASRSNRSDTILLRFTSAGALDPSFGTSGIATIEIPAAALGGATFPEIESLVQLADGRIMIGGTVKTKTDDYRLFVARLTSAGALDPTFADAGFAFPFIREFNKLEEIKAMAVQPDNRVMAVGLATNPRGTRSLIALRFEP